MFSSHDKHVLQVSVVPEKFVSKHP